MWEELIQENILERKLGEKIRGRINVGKLETETGNETENEFP